MAEQKESSVLFSLKELMNLEENRIKEEEQEKERRARHEAEMRAAAERSAREAEERRIREEEEARRSEENRRREEAARLEAIKHGEIEKARAEAEHRSRMEAMAQAQAHEQQLVALQSHSGNKRLKVVIAVVSAVLVLGGVTTAVLVSKSNEEAAKRLQAEQAQRAATEAEIQRLKSDFDTSQKKQEELERQRDSAKDEATRANLEAELAKQKEKTQKAGAALRGGGGGGKPAGAAAKPCNCPPGDPLCSCL